MKFYTLIQRDAAMDKYLQIIAQAAQIRDPADISKAIETALHCCRTALWGCGACSNDCCYDGEKSNAFLVLINAGKHLQILPLLICRSCCEQKTTTEIATAVYERARCDGVLSVDDYQPLYLN